MGLYIVTGYGWGWGHNAVRAESKGEAIRLAGFEKGDYRVEVIELDPEGPASVLWCHDYSPDSRPGD